MSKGLDKGQRRLWLALVKVLFSVTSISLYSMSLIVLTMSWIQGKRPVKCNRPTWKERQWARAIERGVLYWGHSSIGPLDSSPLVPTAPPGPGESSAQSGLAHLLSSSAAFKICGHLLIINFLLTFSAKCDLWDIETKTRYKGHQMRNLLPSLRDLLPPLSLNSGKWPQCYEVSMTKMW